MESHLECSYDHLDVYNGPNDASPSLGRFCGSKKPPPVFSSTNKMFLQFFSDNSVQKRGFEASFTTGNRTDSVEQGLLQGFKRWLKQIILTTSTVR